MKKIVSTSRMIFIAGAVALSSVSVMAEESSNETMSTQVDTTTSTTITPAATSATPTTDVTSTTTTSVVTPTTTSVTSVPAPSNMNTSTDRNNDGTTDAFEQCAFAQKQPEANCSALKETMKKKMWEQYGSGIYNPNAFERNQNGGIMMKELNKKINSEKKEMSQEIKNDKVKMMKENEQNRQMMGNGANQENKENRQEFKEGAKQQKQDFKKEVQIKKRALSEKLHGQLTTAVEKLPVEKLNRVLTNIDKAVTKIESSTLTQEKKDNFLAQLEEIRVVIQDKIDALTGAASDTLNLNEILGGTAPTDTTTTTGTTTTGTVTQ